MDNRPGRKPFCQCLYEIENKLPRTIFCFMPCNDQHEITKQREKEKIITFTVVKRENDVVLQRSDWKRLGVKYNPIIETDWDKLNEGQILNEDDLISFVKEEKLYDGGYWRTTWYKLK